MLYEIKLRIDYSYQAGSDHSRALLRLLPSDIPGEQSVRQRLLTVDPLPSERREGRDFFGNATVSLAWHQPIPAVTITLTARVDRTPSAPQLALSPPLSALAAELAGIRDLGPDSPQHFAAQTRRTRADDAMRAFALALVGPETSALDAVERLSHALHEEMRFDAEATDVDTPAAQAFANRHGVCQDFTHILIACLREIGVPAAYVSGFLRTDPPPGQPRLEGADAMHAWVRAWAGAEMGWIEIDPTNDQRAGEDYITVARGRDYDDVAPVRGAMRSAGEQASSQAVDVMPLGKV